VLEDAVPEVADLNKNYQGLSKLHSRVAERAQGQPSLGHYAGRAAMGAAGSAVGHVLGGGTPGSGIAGAVIAQAANSVPFKTGLASGLNSVGKMVGPAGRFAQGAALPATLAGVANGNIPEKADDASPELIQDQPNNGSGENFDQASPSNESIAPTPAPVPDAVSAPKSNQALQKGTPVTHAGNPGKVVYVHPQMGLARVRLDDGKTITVRTSALKPVPHTVVKSHIRRIATK
jgi:hypothetical protein